MSDMKRKGFDVYIEVSHVTDAMLDLMGDSDREAIHRLGQVKQQLAEEIGKKIIGQQEVVTLLLTALFSQGHSLLMGVPGLAKTSLVATLAEVLDLDFKRVQFTPDLMPADITGTEILTRSQNGPERVFHFIEGPIFTNILLADEINRAPPKTQAALLQSMQEQEVSVGNVTHKLPKPYLVFATQNPIEQEGTYPLPEAELDRFMFLIHVDYPSEEEEQAIVDSTTGIKQPKLNKILEPSQVLELQQLIRKVPVAPEVIKHAIRLVNASRPGRSNGLPVVKQYVSWGAGPRAGQYLILGAKTRAALAGRYAAAAEDVRWFARPVLRHRIITNYHAEISSVSSLDIVDQILEQVKP